MTRDRVDGVKRRCQLDAGEHLSLAPMAWSSATPRVARLAPESGDIIWRVQLLAPVLVRHGSRGPTRMVSLVRCTMFLDAARHGYRPEIQLKAHQLQ
jgi:hypothetical protein